MAIEKSMGKLSLIQGLRGVASLLVVLFHTSEQFKEKFNQNFLLNVFNFGFSGVDIFFVLSGFIIMYAHKTQIGDFKKIIPFLRKRLIRIYPIYWLLVSGLLIVTTFLTGISNFNINSSNILKTYLLLPNHFMVIGVTWSLSNELFFYAAFICAFLFKNKLVFRSICLAYVLIVFWYNIFNVSVNAQQNWLSCVLAPQNIEFLFGILVALIYKKVNIGWSKIFIISGIILFLSSSFLYALPSFNMFGFNRVVFFGLPSLCLLLGCTSLENTMVLTPIKLITSLGDASYTLYLIHLPLIAFGLRIIKSFAINNTIFSQLISLGLVAFIVILSIYIYRFLERPLMQLLSSKLK
jgi:exopolysaccharide production protein ExoZ